MANKASIPGAGWTMKTRVLVIEDDFFQCELYRVWLLEILKPSGDVLVEIIGNGRDAEQALKEHSYDITFMDLAVPNVSGPVLVSKFRSRMGRLVIVSSYPEASPAACKAADRVIQKPVNISDLVSELKIVVGGNPCVKIGRAHV